jgi:hypothetical protein
MVSEYFWTSIDDCLIFFIGSHIQETFELFLNNRVFKPQILCNHPFGWGGIGPPALMLSLYIYRIRMRSARGFYIMNEWECKLMRKQFNYL